MHVVVVLSTESLFVDISCHLAGMEVRKLPVCSVRGKLTLVAAERGPNKLPTPVFGTSLGAS